MKLKYTIPAGFEYNPLLLDTILNNHTLIAGSTGAGKSVLENNILYSFLCEFFPFSDGSDAAQLVLIDPKKVELSIYKNLPHCILYADNITDTIQALKTIKNIVADRLNEMQKKGIRKSEKSPIYIIFDEIITLIESKYKKELIELIADIISISRCTNIFFIIFTQNPARGKIPSCIQLNCNCRIALYCNSRIESIEILGEPGAEKLPFHGKAIVRKDIQKYYINIPMYNENNLLLLIDQWKKQNRIKRMLLKAL